MDVNANDVQVFLWKLLKFSSKTFVSFALKYPFVSFTILFLFLLYLIFPSVFWLLIYLFPFIVSTALILRILPSLRNAKEYKRDEKNNDGKACGTIVVRNGKSLVHVRSVRRRRAKDIRREDDDDSHNNVDEKSTIFSTSICYDLVDKRALVEECPKEIREVEVDSSSNTSQCSYPCTSKSLKPKFCNGSYGRSEKFNFGGSEIETSEDSEDEEEAREAGNKAVEWTVDDQKNLMDLGISEIERNKRLESLIARRKARKLFSLQVRRALRNMSSNDPAAQISHITIPKNNLLPNNISQLSPGPGSAPSVLIPMRNPFDLPYDPYEEKPDLTGDSFNQEFMAVMNKDVMFCRHESFSLGVSLPREFMQDCAESSAYRDFGLRQRASKGIECSKPGIQIESKFNGIVEPEPFQKPEPKTKVDSSNDQIKEVIQVCEQELELHNEEDNVEVQTKPIPSEDVNGRPNSSSSEEDEPFYKIDKDAILKSIASPATRIIAEDRESNGKTGDLSNYHDPHFAKTRSEERLCYANKTPHYHARGFSIASDLQVEFSEVSSPLTHDENLSSQDEEISIYDVDLDKEITSSSEDLWAAASHLSGIDENESRSREVHEISDKDIIEVGFSRINKSEDMTPSNTLAEKVTEQSSIGTDSFSPPKTDFPNSYKGHTADFSAKIHGKLQSCLFSAQESSDPSEKLKSDLNAICDVNGTEIPQDDRGYQFEQSLTINSESTEQIGSQSEKQDKCHHMLESTGSVSDNQISSEDSDSRLKKVLEHEEMAATSTPFEDHNSLQFLQRIEDEPCSSEVGTSGTAQESENPQASVSPTNVAVEQIPAAPSPCSSPQSVLQQNFSVDNLSEFQQNIQMEVGQLHMVVENNIPDELRTEVSSEILSQSSMPSEDSNHPSNGADIEQESSLFQEKSTGKVDAHIDIDEPTNYEDQMQNSVLCDDTGHEGQLNHPMDHEECSRAPTSESSEETKVDLQKVAEDRTPTSSMLVEENDNLGTHKKYSEEDEEAICHANTHGSTLCNEVKLEISTSNGESRDETILLGVPKERNDSENSITCITTEEPTNSSSRNIEESTKPLQSEETSN